MTILTETRKAGPYVGNGSQTAFTFDFKVFETDDILVLHNDGTVESELVLDSDYSVALNPDQDNNPGGTVTYPLSGAALSSTEKLAIIGGLEYTQETDLTNGGAYFAQSHEDRFDYLTILIQQLLEILSRTVKVSPTSGLVPEDLLDPDLVFTLAPNSVGTQHLIDGSVNSAKILDGSILLEDLNQEVLDFITSFGNFSSVTGLVAINDTVDPDNKVDVSASVVVVSDPDDDSVAIITAPAAITIDISVVGPAVNGRDQVGAFSNSSWVHLYYIYNGTDLNGIASAVAPEAGGPVFPAGYTKWAYIGAYYVDSAGDLLPIRFLDDTAFHLNYISVLEGGQATTDTSIDTSAAVPPNAISASFLLMTQCAGGLAQGTQATTHLGFTPGEYVLQCSNSIAASAPVNELNSFTSELPNVNQALNYKVVIDAGTALGGFGYVRIYGFKIRN